MLLRFFLVHYRDLTAISFRPFGEMFSLRSWIMIRITIVPAHPWTGGPVGPRAGRAGGRPRAADAAALLPEAADRAAGRIPRFLQHHPVRCAVCCRHVSTHSHIESCTITFDLVQ